MTTELRDAAERIAELSNHGIPVHAYGDHEAACDMANRLETIWMLTQELSAALAAVPQTEFFWLVELFYTDGRPTGMYLTSLPAPQHQTPDVHKAWKLTVRDSAERQARKAPCLAGTQWRAVEHGFEPSPQAVPGWQPIETAPKDGTEVELLVRHKNYQFCDTDEKRAKWEAVVLAKWIDFNGGGWTWRGMFGEALNWRLPASPQAVPQEPTEREKAAEDFLKFGTYVMQDGKRIDPRTLYPQAVPKGEPK